MEDDKFELNMALVNWLLSSAGPRPDALAEISTTGSGPLHEDDFDELVWGIGVEVSLPSEDSEILVIGREQWDRSLLEQVLEGRSGLHLRVYSQEMLLAYLISHEDPLDEDEDTVRTIAGDHPALKFLDGVGFRWPSTLIPGLGDGRFDTNLLEVEEGYLKYTGYRVGKEGRKRGLGINELRQRLRFAYESKLPPQKFPPDYIREWGHPKSSQRLSKIAESIAAFCRNNKRKKAHSPLLAIQDYESDLEWLKREFYNGRYRFQWPSTAVWWEPLSNKVLHRPASLAAKLRR